MTRKIINLSNYVCNPYEWYVAMQTALWDDMKDENPRLRRWINPPPIEPLRYFFKIDAGQKGWTWTKPLENCYGFLITYYADPNLIIMTGSELGGREQMENSDDLPQLESPGMFQVDWNIPWLADLDRAFTEMIDNLGLGIPTWLAYTALTAVIYFKVKK